MILISIQFILVKGLAVGWGVNFGEMTSFLAKSLIIHIVLYNMTDQRCY